MRKDLIVTHPVSHTTGEPRPTERRTVVETTGDLNVVKVGHEDIPKQVRDLPPTEEWGAETEPDAEGWYALTGALAGAKVRTEFIAAGDLVSDPIREIREGRVRDLMRRFDRGKLGTLLVSRRADGRQVVIEGNHRLMTIKRLRALGLVLRCEVYVGLNLAQEEFLWEAEEDRLRPTPLDKLVAGIQGQKKVSLEIVAALAAAGPGVGLRGAPGAKWPYVEAGRQVIRAYERFGQRWLTSGAGHARRSWPKHRSAFDGHVLLALAWVRSRYANIDTNRLDERLKTTTPKALREAGAQLHKLLKSRHRDPLAQCIASVIVGLYNARLTVNKLEEWDWER